MTLSDKINQFDRWFYKWSDAKVKNVCDWFKRRKERKAAKREVKIRQAAYWQSQKKLWEENRVRLQLEKEEAYQVEMARRASIPITERFYIVEASWNENQGGVDFAFGNPAFVIGWLIGAKVVRHLAGKRNYRSEPVSYADAVKIVNEFASNGIQATMAEVDKI